jgi:hypothetical protein
MIYATNTVCITIWMTEIVMMDLDIKSLDDKTIKFQAMVGIFWI